MHIGVIGSGRIGVMHALNAATHPRVSRVSLSARKEERLNAALDELKAGVTDPSVTLDATTDLAGLLPRLDGVVIATSTPSHPPLVRQAVAAGVPVLVEKPLALELDELKELSAELEAQDVPVMVAFQRRYDTAYQKARELIAAGEIGKVRHARASGHDRLQIPLDYIPDSGGMWRDMVIHDFDIIPWVLGEEVVEVYATGAVIEEPTYAEHCDLDTAVAVLTFASGAIATISGIRHNEAGQDVRLEVFGTKNTIGVGQDEKLPVTSLEPGIAAPTAQHADFMARFEQAFRNEMDHFIGVVTGEATNLTPPSAGISSLKLALAAAESVQNGRPVTID